MKDWVENGVEDPVETHWWFAGQTGAAVSVYNTVADYQLDHDVIVPVFDQVCPYGIPSGEDDNPCKGLWHEGDSQDYVVESGGNWTDYFHVISFAIFHVQCIDAGRHPMDRECTAHDTIGINIICTADGN